MFVVLKDRFDKLSVFATSIALFHFTFVISSRLSFYCAVFR